MDAEGKRADAVAGIVIGVLLASIGLRLAARNRALLTNHSESPVILDREASRREVPLSGDP